MFERLMMAAGMRDEDGNMTHHAVAQKDADWIIPYIHEFYKLTDKDGNPLKIVSITVLKTGDMNFNVKVDS